MFKELIKLRELARLCRQKKWREVLDLARDPSIRDHRKAVTAAERARQALLDDAVRRSEQGELTRAFENVRTVLKDQEAPEARQMERDVRKAIGDRDARARAVATAEDVARRREAAAELLRQADECIRSGALSDACGIMCRIAVRDSPGDVTDPVWTRLVEATIRNCEPAVLAEILEQTRQRAGSDAGLQAARQAAAVRLVAAIEALVVGGDVERAAGLLARYPLGTAADAAAATLQEKVGRVSHALRLGDAGDPGLAAMSLGEALASLPSSRALKERLRKLEAASESAREPLQEARVALSRGHLAQARGLLLDVLESQPEHREAADLLSAVERQTADDLETLRKAQDLLGLGVEGSLDDCRRLLVGMEARRPDLAELPVLLRDVDRRIRDARLRTPVSPAASGRLPADGARAQAIPEAGSGSIAPGAPFILRVEEQGDWFVHPADRVLLGNSLRGIADLPVLAAIGSRHAWFERQRTASGDTQYRLVVEPGKRTMRNRRRVESFCQLSHGDVIVLGEVLSFTFLRPVPASATATIRFDGDFSVKGCRQVILFAETGRAGSLVIGPAPEAHVPLGREAERVEVFRGTEGEGQGLILARCPRGVAVGDGVERPQVRVPAGVAIRAGEIGFFLDQI